MKQIFRVISLLFFLALINSCTTLTPLTSKRVDMSTVKEVPDFCNYFNSDTKIRYGFGNDDSTFYLKLEVLDDDITMNGLKVYFDATDKTSKDIYLNFPIKNQPRAKNSEKAGFVPPNEMDANGNNSKKPDIAQMIPTTAAWSVYDDVYQFNWRLEKTPFAVNVSTGNIDQLVYEAYIPIDQIIKLKDDSNFTMGIEIEGTGKTPSGNGGSDMTNGGSGGGKPGGPGNGPGGAMPRGSGGGPGGGPSGKMPGGKDMPERMGNKSSNSQIFWVQIELKK
jgi:hypothetical protein